MSPETHLFASWIIAAKATRHPRDCRLVALAGLLPDADGVGLLVDAVAKAFGARTFFYAQYHHYLLHGIFGAALISVLLAVFARERLRVGLLAFGVFHLHLLCDLVGSRGPAPHDLWPIFYLGPFTKDPMWIWKGQWRLDGWQNQLISLSLLAWSGLIAIRQGHSFVGVFHRGADRVVVGVLRKWAEGLRSSPVMRKLRQPPWRTVVPAVMLLAAIIGRYALWEPGMVIEDGRHDLKRNGIWIGHGWLGADEWFERNRKMEQLTRFRDETEIVRLAGLLRKHHIRDVFPHLCPADANGELPPLDDAQAERFLSAFSGFRVLPWVGGSRATVRHFDQKWRSRFVASVTDLIAKHPGFGGIHLNVEPLSSGDPDFLLLLEELRASLSPGKVLSVAAYPPPTVWHRFPEVHWEEAYFREVSRRSDQVVVMMYDTSLRWPKLYRHLMAGWTSEVLEWSERRPVLLGIPTYSDTAADYHDPRVENLENALRGVHAALAVDVPPRSYQGVAIYCEWETDDAEWDFFRRHFLKP